MALHTFFPHLLIATALMQAISLARGGPLLEKTFYTEHFEMAPGSVAKAWYPVDMPEGHIGIRSVFAEIVDDNLKPVPLSECYLHHWVLRTFYEGEPEPTDASGTGNVDALGNKVLFGVRGVPVYQGHEGGMGASNAEEGSKGGEVELSCNATVERNVGIYYGVGAETRHTVTTYPAPYVVEFNPNSKSNIWKAQVHGIDLRATHDPWGCLECQCDLYNTDGISALGEPLSEDYIGGYLCCYTNKTCAVTETAKALPVKKRFLKFVVQYEEWDECSVPMKVYFLDVAGCRGEYDVPACEPHKSVGECVHKQSRTFMFPRDGHLIFAEGHQHYGALGNKLSRENGEVICDSLPLFGRGQTDEAGDEAGFLTGVSTCAFQNKEVFIKAHEKITMDSVYSRLGGHTGVMGQYIIYIAELEDHKDVPAYCFDPETPQLPAGGSGETSGHSVGHLILTGVVSSLVTGVTVALVTISLLRKRLLRDGFTSIPQSA